MLYCLHCPTLNKVYLLLLLLTNRRVAGYLRCHDTNMKSLGFFFVGGGGGGGGWRGRGGRVNGRAVHMNSMYLIIL